MEEDKLNSKGLCKQQIYGNGVYKDCNDLPVGETAIAFATALNKPSEQGIYFIFCIGSVRDNVKYQLAIRYLSELQINVRLFNNDKGSWTSWK